MYELIYTDRAGQFCTDRAPSIKEICELAWLTVALQDGEPLQIKRGGTVVWDAAYQDLYAESARKAQEAEWASASMRRLAAQGG